VRRAAVATRALAARVNLWTVRPTTNLGAARFPHPTHVVSTISVSLSRRVASRSVLAIVDVVSSLSKRMLGAMSSVENVKMLVR